MHGIRNEPIGSIRIRRVNTKVEIKYIYICYAHAVLATLVLCDKAYLVRRLSIMQTGLLLCAEHKSRRVEKKEAARKLYSNRWKFEN